MAVRIRPDGSVEVDTDEEILRVSRLFASAKAAPAQSSAVDVAAHGDGSVWDTFMSFVQAKEGQMRFLTFLKGKEEISISEMKDAMGLGSTNAVSGTVAGLVKNAKKAGVAISKIVKIKKTGRQPHVLTTYLPGKLLKESAL